VTILERANAGETDSMIAASLGCSHLQMEVWLLFNPQPFLSFLQLPPMVGRS
jgi:hypothetical protein